MFRACWMLRSRLALSVRNGVKSPILSASTPRRDLGGGAGT